MSEEARDPGALAPAAHRAELLDGSAILATLLLLLIINEGGIPWVRLLLTLAFTFFVPGRAIVSNWPRIYRWAPEAMSIVFSLAILTLLATVTLWAHFWHPIPLFEVEAVLSLTGLVTSIVRRRRRGEPVRVADAAGHDHAPEPTRRVPRTPTGRRPRW